MNTSNVLPDLTFAGGVVLIIIAVIRVMHVSPTIGYGVTTCAVAFLGTSIVFITIGSWLEKERRR